MTKLLLAISGLLAALTLFLSGYKVEVKKVADLVLGATQVVDNANCKSASATSSLTYMTKGTATTSVTCVFGQDAAHTAVLAILVNASSTASIFEGIVEESVDGQDWFPINANKVASTSAAWTLTNRGTFNFRFASSTIGAVAVGNGANRLGVNGTDNRNHYEIEIPVNMKRVRAYLYPTSDPEANGAAWMQVIPKIEF